MKKCISMLLTLAMMLSLIPAASATEAADIPEIEPEIVQTISKEDLACEIEAEQLADEAKLTEEQILAREEARRARVEASIAAAQAAYESESDLDETLPVPEVNALKASANEYTVKVKLEFSSAATRDTEIRYDFYDNENYFGAWYDGEATLKKGSSSLTLSIPVEKGSYCLELYGNTGWTYADIYGELSNEWEDRLHIGVFGSNKTINLTVDADDLLAEEEYVEPTGSEVKVTVKLPAKTTAASRYRTFLRSGDSAQILTENLASGKDTYTETFTTSYSTFVVGYYDGTNIDGWYYPTSSSAFGMRYLAKDGGITTKYSEAKVFTLSETSSITIDDSKNYALTGTLKLYGKQEYNKGMYAVAELGNGEQFSGHAYFPAGSTSANYTIYVPKSHSGSTFTHWAAETYDWNTNRLLEGSRLDGSKYTLSGNASLKDISLPEPPVILKGTFSLPNVIKAPTGGLNVAIEYYTGNSWESSVFNLPAGKSSFDFAITPTTNASTVQNLTVYIENAPDNVCDEFYVDMDEVDPLDLDLTAYETVLVSGSITVPDKCKDLGSNHRFYTYASLEDGRDYNGNLYISVLPGQTTAPYEIKVLKNGENTQLNLEVDRDASGKLLSTDLRLVEEDGEYFFGDSWSEITLTENLSGIDANYELGKTITGTISLSDGIPAGYYYGEICADPVDGGGDDCRNSFHFEGTEGTFSVAVPVDYTGAYRLYCYLYAEDETNALTDCQLYYSTSGVTTDRDSATQFTVPADGLDGIDLLIPPAKTVSGNILLAEGLPANGRYYGDVYIFDSNGNEYSGYFNSNNNRGMTYTVRIPLSDENLTYTIAVYCYKSDNTPPEVVPYTYFYIGKDGSMTASEADAKQFTIGASGLVQDVTIPKGQTFTVTLNAPAGFSGDYSGRIYMYDLDNYSTTNNINFSFTDSGTVTFTVPVGSSANKTLYLRVNEGEGVITGDYFYYNGETNSWVTDTDDAAPIDTSSGSISVSLPAAKVVTINVAPPAGFSGAYRGYIQLDGNSYNYQEFEFNSTNGSGTKITFTLPDNDTATYRLRIYMYEGEGVITSSNYYYTADGTWTTSSSDGAYMTAANLPTSITMPAAKVVSFKINPPAGCSGTYRGSMQLDGNGYNYQEFEFNSTNGSGTTVNFSLPDSATATYRLRIYMYEGVGTMTGKTYYYTADGSWSNSSSDGKYMTIDEMPTSLTMPAGKIITGKLVAADGSAVNLGIDENQNGYGYIGMNAYSGSYISPSYHVNADGTFTVTIPEDATGTHRFYFSPRENRNCNVISGGYYYYVKDATTSCTDSSSATAVDVSGDVSELTILVDTGYLLTGTVELGEGATMSSTDEDNSTMARASLYLRENVDDDAFYDSLSVYLYPGSTSWSYSFAVPKKAATYTLTMNELDLYNNTTSNVYDGKAVISSSVAVSGNTTLPAVKLMPTKYTIQVNITKPIDDYVSGTVHVVTDDADYESDFSISASDSSNVAEIRIPGTETSSTYKLYYYAYNAEGIQAYKNIYLAADGSLTTDETKAANFGWSTTIHSFTMKEVPPYATGKIYLPDCTDDEDFSIRLYGYSTYTTFDVNSDTIQTDENGAKYIPYALFDTYASSGYTYHLAYCLNSDYTGTALYSKGTSSSYRVYLLPSGEVSYEYDYSNYFTIPESGTNNLDFSLVSWNDGSEDNIFQSAHGIPGDSTTATYTYTYPNATKLSVTFSERTDVNLTINGKTYYYYSLNYGSPITVDVSGTNGVMEISAHNSSDRAAYGFGITSVIPYYSAYPTAPDIASVSTDNGSTDAIVMADLKAGEDIRVTLAGPADFTGTALVAIYDSTGKMLDMALKNVTFTYGSAALTPDFDGVEAAATLKIMLLDGTTLVPKMAVKSISG